MRQIPDLIQQVILSNHRVFYTPYDPYHIYQKLKIKAKRLQEEILAIEKVIERAEGGDHQALMEINLPAKYIPEEVARSMNLDWREIKL